jgi:AraC-like DNA-binding protein
MPPTDFESPFRREWIYQLVREVQVFAGLILDEPLDKEELARVRSCLPQPESHFEDMLIRGAHALLAERNALPAGSASAGQHDRTAEPPICHVGRKHDACARRALHILTNRFREAWTRPALAREVGCNRTVLGQAFKQSAGCTLHEFLVLQRVEAAKRLLNRSDTKASRVHAEVGYLSNAAFVRHFKALTGLTPNEYRQRVNQPGC